MVGGVEGWEGWERGMGEVVRGISGGSVGVMVGMYEGGLEKGNDVIWGGLKKVEWGLVV